MHEKKANPSRLVGGGIVGQLGADTLQAAGIKILPPLGNGCEAPGKLLNYPVPLLPHR